MYNIATLDGLKAPVPSEDLIDWARLDSDDPKIESSLLIATAQVISFLKLELLPRAYTLTYEDWPICGTVTSPSLSRANYRYKLRVDLPYTNLVSVESVTVNGTAATVDDYRLLPGKPYQIEFEQFSTGDTDNPALVIEYTAGYADFSRVPDTIKNGIKMVAAYIHVHAGGCDVGDAVKMSGAADLLRPYAVNAGLSF
jgi:hypothetical protein